MLVWASARLCGISPLLLKLHHALWVACPVDGLLFGLVEGFGVKVVAALDLRFFFFNFYSILPCKGIVADAGHLPGHSHIRCVGLDSESIAFNLFADNGLSKSAD